MPPLVEVRHLVKHFTRGGGLFRPKTVVTRRRRCELRDRRGRDVRAGRRIGQRQEHDRPLHAAAGRADVRRGPVPRRRRAGVLERAAARGAARHADGLPGPVLVAQSADARVHDRRRAAGHPRDRLEDRAARARGGAVPAGRPRSGAPRSLSARVQRRPAAAHRPGARAGARTRRSSSPTSRSRRSTCRSRRR